MGGGVYIHSLLFIAIKEKKTAYIISQILFLNWFSLKRPGPTTCKSGGSDVDPDWLYPDPDPQNLTNTDPDPGQ